jgi:hypothetical protein
MTLASNEALFLLCKGPEDLTYRVCLQQGQVIEGDHLARDFGEREVYIVQVLWFIIYGLQGFDGEPRFRDVLHH